MHVSGPTVTLLSSNATPIRLQPNGAQPAPVNKPQPVAPPESKPGIPVAKPAGKAQPVAPVSIGESEPLTVDGMLEKWHQADERYDLNGDGTVGMADLNILLEQLSNAAASQDAPPIVSVPSAAVPEQTASTERTDAPATPSAVDSTDAALAPDDGTPPTTLDGLLDAWHTANDEFDLDGDGIVGMSDLDALLARLNTPPAPADPVIETVAPPSHMEPASPSLAGAIVTETAAAPDAPSTNPADALSTTAPNSGPTLESMLEMWGRNDAKHDLNGDGHVGMADLNMLLARMSSMSGHDEQPVVPRVTARGAMQKLMHGADALGSAVAERLSAAGFDERPPGNVHQLVSRLNLEPAQEKALMSHIADRYPNGLGLDRVG